MAAKEKSVYHFEGFVLEDEDFRLTRDGHRVLLEPKSLRVLIALVRAKGTLVSKSALLEEVWKGTFVEETTLVRAIALLRKQLGDVRHTPRFIETVPTVGYRFIASVEERPAHWTAASEGTGVEEPLDARDRAPAKRRWIWIGSAAAMLLLSAAGVLWLKKAPTVTSAIHSVAVLPLENLSSDASMEYFADGMTSELITELASIPQLRVVSYTSVMREKGKRNSLPDIARKLGVDAIAEGSVERSKNKVRLNVQLIDARTDRELWAQSFDDTADDVLALQQHVAEEIAAHAQVLLTPSLEARLGTAQRLDPAAYDGYLQGRYLLNKRDATGSIPLFRKAVALDPNYARAWAGLAAGLADLAMGTPNPRSGPVKEAKEAAEHAIQLDSQTGEAWSTLGLIAMLWEWDWKTAEHDLQRAIALSPGDSATELNYATYLSMVGRHDEAVSHMRRALELDPLSFFNVRHMGSVLYWARRYDEALEYLGKAREMEPELGSFTQWWISDSYEMKGMRAEAVLAELRETADTESSRTRNALLATYRAGGAAAYWQSRVTMTAAQKPSGECPPFGLALLYGHLGKSGEILKQLNEIVNDHCFEATMLKAEPMFDSVHGNSQYQALIQEVRLPPD